MIEPLFALYLALCTPNKAFCIYETTEPAFVSESVCFGASEIVRSIRSREFNTTLIVDDVDCFKEKTV